VSRLLRRPIKWHFVIDFEYEYYTLATHMNFNGKHADRRMRCYAPNVLNWSKKKEKQC